MQASIINISEVIKGFGLKTQILSPKFSDVVYDDPDCLWSWREVEPVCLTWILLYNQLNFPPILLSRKLRQASLIKNNKENDIFFEPRIVKRIHILCKYSGAQCTLMKPELLIFRTYGKGRPLWNYWFLTECVHIWEEIPKRNTKWNR